MSEAASLFLKGRGAVLCLLVLVAASYATSLTVPFIDGWDDDAYVTRNGRTQQPGLSGLARVWNPADAYEGRFVEYFPLRDTVYWGLWQLAGANRVVFHLANLLAHLVTCLLLLRLAPRLGFSEWVAFWAACLFAVHPIHVESVTWISGLKDPLFTALSIAALLAFLRYRETPRPGLAALYVSAMLAALLCKSIALVIPLLALSCDLLLEPASPWKTALRRQLGPLMLSAAFFAHFLIIGRANHVLIPPHGGSWAQHYLLMAWALIRYLQQALVPSGFRTYYCFAPIEGAADPRAWAGLLVVLLLAGLALSVKRQPRVALLGLWFLICLGPVSNLVPFPAIMADRYLYAPSVAACLAIAWGLSKLPGTRAGLAAALVVGVFGFICVLRGVVWQDPVNLWAEAIDDGACAADVSGKGSEMFIKHASTTPDGDAAMVSWKAAFTHPGFSAFSPEDRAEEFAAAASAALRLREVVQARQWAAAAVEVAPGSPSGWVITSELPGPPADAVLAAEKALAIRADTKTHMNLGVKLLAAGRTEDAVPHVIEAVQLDPRRQCRDFLAWLPSAPTSLRPSLEETRRLCRGEPRP